MSRVNLVLGDIHLAKVEAIKGQLDTTSTTEIIRRSINLMHFLTQTSMQGDQLFVRDDSGSETKIIILN